MTFAGSEVDCLVSHSAFHQPFHPADDSVALVRQQRCHDSVEPCVLELDRHAEPLRDFGADVDVGADGLAVDDHLLRRIADVTAEDEGLRDVSGRGGLNEHRGSCRDECHSEDSPSEHERAPSEGCHEVFTWTRD